MRYHTLLPRLTLAVSLYFIVISVESALVRAPKRQPGQTFTKPRLSSPRIIGWYMGYSNYRSPDYLLPWEIDVNHLTHLIYAFYNVPETSLDVRSGDAWTDHLRPMGAKTPWTCPCCTFGNVEQLLALKKRNPHLQVLFSVGGWLHSYYISDAMASPETRSKMVMSVIDMLLDYGFDGVDMDWEFPVIGGPKGSSKRPEDCVNLVLFFEELRRELERRVEFDKHYLVTLTLYYEGEMNVACYDWSRVGKVVDWVNLLTYEMIWNSTKTRHHAPLYVPEGEYPSIDHTMQVMKQTGMPSDYFIIGIANYGRQFAQVRPSSQASDEGLGEGFVDFVFEPVAYKDILGRLKPDAMFQFKRYWDDQAKAVWAYSSQTRTLISYDDPQSVRAKAQYVLDKGYGGLFFFDISHEKNARPEESLVRAAHAVFGPVKIEDVMCIESRRFCNIDCDPTPPPIVDINQIAPVYENCTKPGQVAFVFTGGPNVTLTERLYSLLDELNVQPGFFLQPSRLSNPDLAWLISSKSPDKYYFSHAGYSFESFTSNMTEDGINEELVFADATLGALFGKRPALVGVPFGSVDRWVLNVMGRMGYAILMPNLDSRDWDVDDITNEQFVRQRVLQHVQSKLEEAEAKGGKGKLSWILGHTDRIAGSVAAFPDLVALVKRYGYQIVGLKECLGDVFPGYRSPLDDSTLGDFRDVNLPINRHCTKPSQVALGFHSAPTDKMEQLLDFLLDRGIRATFFVVGSQLESGNLMRNLVLRAFREGHTIGHHSYTYNSYLNMSDTDILADLRRNDHLIMQLLGKAPTLVLPPFSSSDRRVRAVLRKAGYHIVAGNINIVDYADDLSNAEIASRTIGQFRTGLQSKFDNSQVTSVLALQSLRWSDVNFQSQILDLIKNLGYTLSSLEQCYQDRPKWTGGYRSYQAICGDSICDYTFGESCLACSKDCICPDPVGTSDVDLDTMSTSGFNISALFRFDSRNSIILWGIIFGLIGFTLITVTVGIRVRWWRTERNELRRVRQTRLLGRQPPEPLSIEIVKSPIRATKSPSVTASPRRTYSKNSSRESTRDFMAIVSAYADMPAAPQDQPRSEFVEPNVIPRKKTRPVGAIGPSVSERPPVPPPRTRPPPR